jgi:hypothetical protein
MTPPKDTPQAMVGQETNQEVLVGENLEQGMVLCSDCKRFLRTLGKSFLARKISLASWLVLTHCNEYQTFAPHT